MINDQKLPWKTEKKKGISDAGCWVLGVSFNM
jgi:hypothetical protein